MKQYHVRILQDAELDLIEIHGHISKHDSFIHADHVLDELETLCLNLAELPTRGHVIPELDSIGVKNYREVHFKPYRIIYEIIKQDVFIHCVIDGRRDMLSLLERRLLR